MSCLLSETSDGSRKIPSLNEQKRTKDEIFGKNKMSENETWCLVAEKWYTDWTDSLDNEKKKIGEIDNSILLFSNQKDKNQKVKLNLKNGRDYRLVPKELWELIQQWYGGGPIIERVVRNKTVDVYPLHFKVKRYNNNSNEDFRFIEFAFCGRITFSELLKELKATFFPSETKEDEIIVLKSINNTPYKLLDTNQLQNEPINTIFKRIYNQELVVALKTDKILEILNKRKFKLYQKFGNMKFPSYSKRYYPQHLLREGTAFRPNEYLDQGCVGLNNMGNSCYLNSIVQCLTKNKLLKDYFLELEKNGISINKKNKKVALAFSKLMKDFYSNKSKSVYPRELKEIIGRSNPRFATRQQQDSSEFLLILLELLHNDLKKPLKKPLENGKTKEEKKETSIIHENFQGQFRIEKFCTSCKQKTENFDDFGLLILSVPEKIESSITIFNNANPMKQPRKCKFDINKDKTVGDLVQMIAKFEEIDLKDHIILLAGVSKSERKIEGIFRSSLPLTEIADKKCYGFVFKKEENYEEEMNIFVSLNKFLPPFIIRVKQFETTKGIDIFEKCFESIKRYIRIHVMQVLQNKELRENCFSIDKEESDEALNGGEEPTFKLFLDSGTEIFYSNDLVKFFDKETRKKIDLKMVIPESSSVCYNLNSKNTIDIKHIALEELPENNQKGKVDLMSLIKLELSQEDVFQKCEKCGKKCIVKTKRDLWKTPETLIIQFKRFRSDKNAGRKIRTFIDFSDVLEISKDLTKTKDQKSVKYQLYAISNHIGSTLTLGHYTSYAKIFNKKIKKDVWISFNDENMTEVEEAQTRTNDAYLLFYSKMKTQN